MSVQVCCSVRPRAAPASKPLIAAIHHRALIHRPRLPEVRALRHHGTGLVARTPGPKREHRQQPIAADRQRLRVLSVEPRRGGGAPGAPIGRSRRDVDIHRAAGAVIVRPEGRHQAARLGVRGDALVPVVAPAREVTRYGGVLGPSGAFVVRQPQVGRLRGRVGVVPTPSRPRTVARARRPPDRAPASSRARRPGAGWWVPRGGRPRWRRRRAIAHGTCASAAGRWSVGSRTAAAARSGRPRARCPAGCRRAPGGSTGRASPPATPSQSVSATPS